MGVLAPRLFASMTQLHRPPIAMSDVLCFDFLCQKCPLFTQNISGTTLKMVTSWNFSFYIGGLTY